MSRNQTGGTELIPMPHPTEAAQLSLPIILYGAVFFTGMKLSVLEILYLRDFHQVFATSGKQDRRDDADMK